MTLAAQHDHPGLSALANRFMGQTLSFVGRLSEARQHLQRTLAICSANQETVASYRKFGIDDQVMASSFLALTLLLLGYREQSAATIAKAVARARAMGLPFATALVLNHVALLATLGVDVPGAPAQAQEGLDVSVEHGLAGPEQRARFFQGALLARDGELQPGIELMRAAIAADQKHSARNRHTLYLGLLASAHADLGQPEVGLALLDEAMHSAETSEERFFAAELHRLRGTVLITLGRREDAEAELQLALAIARQQQARWWELRAATALAKHWHKQHKSWDAYGLLHPIYGWFTEGFEAQDLQDAKALLDELTPFARAQTPRALG